jgi:hypothetical protein
MNQLHTDLLFPQFSNVPHWHFVLEGDEYMRALHASIWIGLLAHAISLPTIALSFRPPRTLLESWPQLLPFARLASGLVLTTYAVSTFVVNSGSNTTARAMPFAGAAVVASSITEFRAQHPGASHGVRTLASAWVVIATAAATITVSSLFVSIMSLFYIGVAH